jgi:hypothetical protein
MYFKVLVFQFDGERFGPLGTKSNLGRLLILCSRGKGSGSRGRGERVKAGWRKKSPSVVGGLGTERENLKERMVKNIIITIPAKSQEHSYFL